MQLIRYEQARTALAACHSVDEVKDIRDKAEAMAAYARQAKDQELILWATEIKVRAERKAGEMLATTERHKGGDPRRLSHGVSGAPPTLEEMGINRNESMRWQSLASMSADHFETAVATAKDTAGQVTTAFMLREAGKAKPAKKLNGKDKERLEQLTAARERGVSMLLTYARLTLTALRSQNEFSKDEKSILSDLAEAIQQVSEYEG